MEPSFPDRKRQIRALAQAARRDQPDKDVISRRIVERFLTLPEQQTAETVLWYVDVRDEVRTRYDLPAVLHGGRRIVIPWCHAEGELELFHLESMSELATGRYGILEPQLALRTLSGKRVEPQAVDLAMIPGVAFDCRGGRLGHGRGYYDKLLARVRPDAHLVGLAFECQLFDEIPMDAHDVFLDRVLTEKDAYSGIGRANRDHQRRA